MNWDRERSVEDCASQEQLLREGPVPKHIGFIMDGNGRWAQERGRSRVEGHREGIESVRDIVKAASSLGIKYITLYAFSMENWRRPQAEVNILMDLLVRYLKAELDELHENDVRMLAIGKLNALPKRVQRKLFECIDVMKDNDGLNLTLALSYSGRWDIVRAVQTIALDVRRGKVSPEDITEDLVSSYLLTSEHPDPDLIVRSSGEMRLSNFLLWESAYSEIYITDKYWPEFRRQELYDAIRDYQKRERRFGKTSQQIAQETDDNGIVGRILDKLKF